MVFWFSGFRSAFVEVIGFTPSIAIRNQHSELPLFYFITSYSQYMIISSSINRLAKGVHRVLPVRVEAVVIWRLSFHFHIFIGLTRKNWLRFFSESTLDCRMAVLTFLTN